MGTNLLGELAANNGTYFLNDGQFIGNIDQIIVRGEGVVISELKILVDGNFVDVSGQYLGSTSVPNGLRITPKNDSIFNRVSVTTSSENVGIEIVLA